MAPSATIDSSKRRLNRCSRSAADAPTRKAGEPFQELGVVMMTLSALASCHDMNIEEAGETELARVWQKIDAIRAKQASKPKHSPLPQTETTFSALASAMMKFAPDLAEKLVKRFREAQREQEAGLEEF
jgi:hypothetical protein